MRADTKVQLSKIFFFPCNFIIINHRDCRTRKDHDRLVMNKLEELSVELVVMAGWMRIMGEEIIKRFEKLIKLKVHIKKF